jgi:hypothetical protein
MSLTVWNVAYIIFAKSINTEADPSLIDEIIYDNNFIGVCHETF